MVPFSIWSAARIAALVLISRALAKKNAKAVLAHRTPNRKGEKNGCCSPTTPLRRAETSDSQCCGRPHGGSPRQADTPDLPAAEVRKNASRRASRLAASGPPAPDRGCPTNPQHDP